MNPLTKPNGTQTHQLVLYKRALHPEFFALKGRKAVSHGNEDLEAWVLPGAHLLRFRSGPFAACELVTDLDAGLPAEGAVSMFPCVGEHDFEHRFEPERVKYVTTIQTETLSENLFSATVQDVLSLSQDVGGLLHQWADSDGGINLSMIELARYGREFHASTYHLLSSGGFVLRTQTIFQRN